MTAPEREYARYLVLQAQPACTDENPKIPEDMRRTQAWNGSHVYLWILPQTWVAKRR